MTTYFDKLGAARFVVPVEKIPMLDVNPRHEKWGWIRRGFFLTTDEKMTLNFRKQAKKLNESGGVWVGGRIAMTPASLTFNPNAFDESAYEQRVDREIPTSQIVSAKRHGRPIRNNITLGLIDGTTFTFRCYGTKKLLPLIQSVIASTPRPAEQVWTSRR